MSDKILRQPIRNGLLQSDLNCEGYNLLDVGGVGDIQTHTAIVDSGLASDAFGQVGTGLGFKTLQAAVSAIAAYQTGNPSDTVAWTILMHPGVHSFDGVVELHIPGLTLNAYGAVLQSDTATNEEAKLLISSPLVEINGLELDGNVNTAALPAGYDDADVANGAIEVAGGLGLILRDCYIHDWAAAGIYCPQAYSGLRVEGCNINACQIAMLMTNATGGQAIVGIDINENSITSNRRAAIKGTGNGNISSPKELVDIRVAGNMLSTNNSAGGTESAIEFSGFIRDIIVSGNYLNSAYDGVKIGKALRCTIANNSFVAMANTGINIDGSQEVVVTGNNVDCRTNTGTRITTYGLYIGSGFYLTSGDTGSYLISGNLVYEATQYALYVLTINNALIVGNRFSRSCYIAAYLNLQIHSNVIEILSGHVPLTLDTLGRNCVGFSFVGNRISITGSTPPSVITTVDASASGFTGFSMIANSSTVGLTWSAGILSQTSGAVPTNLYLSANQPQSTTRTSAGAGYAYDQRYGWVNNNTMPAILVHQVLVSQKYGNDSTGARERSDLPFLTIGAAITAATAGDTVLVQDGNYAETISAKNNVTLRFTGQAFATNCQIISTANSQTFTLYHQHAAFINTTDTTYAITISHSGATFNIYASIISNGTSAAGINCTAGTIEIWGNVTATYWAVSIPSGTGTVLLHGSASSSTSTALSIVTGKIVVDSGGTIQGTNSGIVIACDAATCIFKGVTIVGATTYPAVAVLTPGTIKPIFRSCVLVSGSSATDSITLTSGSQTIKLYGQTVANKGANPPTGVTFVGGGTYVVDANVTKDS